MHVKFHSNAWRHAVRIGALTAAVLAMAGCATGYSFVQPNVTGGGAYYTGEGPYPAADYYGYGGYYGAGPYVNPFGWYGGYGPYGYGSSISFSLGFGNAWPWFGGFYGGGFGFPFYTGIGYPFPFYGFDGYGLRRFHHRYYHGGGHYHGGHYYHGGHRWTGMAGNHAWMHAHPWHDPRFARGPGAPGRVRFAPQDFVHAPARVARVRGVMGMGPPRLVDPPRANDAAFAARRMMRMPSAVAMPPQFPSAPAPAFRSAMPDMSMPRAFQAAPRPAFRAAPMHFAAPRAAGRPGIKVP